MLVILLVRTNIILLTCCACMNYCIEHSHSTSFLILGQRKHSLEDKTANDVTKPMTLSPLSLAWAGRIRTHQANMEVNTLPQPFIRSIAILADFGNVSYKISANCGESCLNISQSGQLADPGAVTWQTVVQDVSFVTFPVIVSCGILAGILSIVVLSMKLQHCENCFLVAYSTACVSVLLCGATLRLEDYTGHSNAHQYVYGSLKAAQSWFANSALWILVITMMQRRSLVARQITSGDTQTCGHRQAGIASIVIYSVNLISCIPQLWAYETVEVYDYSTNETLMISHASDAANTTEYNTVYFWYIVAISVLLPYPMILIKLVLIASGLKHSHKLLSQLPDKCGTRSVLHCKIAEEIHLNQYFVITSGMYLFLAGPVIILNMIDHLNVNQQLSTNQIYAGLHCISDLTFYIYFTLPFPLMWGFSDTFRCSLVRITNGCRCKLSKKQPKTLNKHRLPKKQKVVTFLMQ